MTCQRKSCTDKERPTEELWVDGYGLFSVCKECREILIRYFQLMLPG